MRSGAASGAAATSWTAGHTYSVTLQAPAGATFRGAAYILRQPLFTHFPGPMFPPNFQLLLVNREDPEAEEHTVANILDLLDLWAFTTLFKMHPTRPANLLHLCSRTLSPHEDQRRPATKFANVLSIAIACDLQASQS